MTERDVIQQLEEIKKKKRKESKIKTLASDRKN